MALRKTLSPPITRSSLSYHRVFQIIEEVNRGIFIFVRSYVSETDRNAEKDGSTVYSEDCYYEMENVAGPITAQEAYEWLKAERPEFEGAEDVLEESNVGG